MKSNKNLYSSAFLVAAGLSLAAAPLAAQAARAHSSPAASDTAAAIVRANNEVGLGLLGAYSNLKQHDGDLSLNGWMEGAAGYARTMFDYGGVRHLYLSLEDHYGLGPTHQSGVGSDDGYQHQNSVYLKFGKGFEISSAVMLTPYLQYGDQYQNRNLGGDRQFTIQNQLAGAGLLAQYAYTPRLVLSADVNVSATVNPKASYTNTHTRLGTRALEQVAFGMDYRLTDHFHAFGQVGYDRRDYAVDTADLRQNNTTVETGVAYHF